jgi:hypothetical protein
MLVSSPLDFFELGRAESVHRPSRTRKSFPSRNFSSLTTSSPTTMGSSQVNGEAVLVEALSSLAAQDSSLVTDSQQQIPPHLSHDPKNGLKRSDPFQFGSRLLSQEDNVFEFNAWDHVETDDTYKEYAELQYAKQREAPVSEFDKSTYFFSSSLGGYPCAT